ncbi:MAG TPA: hypothetical protein VNZ64_03825 [Candidatus Acidoferrum sp.]|jgi:hypothetical protein|nr:hypothetical protein [Candidatus Acidoferrum sp.]
MNRRSIIPSLAGAVALLGLATGLALEHQTRLELRQEQQALQQQLDRVTDLLAGNERQASLPVTAKPAQSLASDPSTELLRLRAELGVLGQLTNEFQRARNDNTEAHAALDRYLAGEAVPKVATADFWPRDSWNFTGFGSPDDALRSSLWASNNGNLKALLDSTTGEFRQMMEKEFEGKSAEEAAIRAMDEVSNLKSVQVVNRDFQSADTAVLTAAFEDGDQTHTTKVLLKKVGNEWKLAGMNDN